MTLMTAIADWRSRWTAARELKDLDSGELGALARDICVSPDRLSQLAICGDAAGAELPRFMDALGVSPEAIGTRHGRLMRSMSVTCSICAKTAQCRRDLGHGRASLVRSYCPNVEIIDALKSAAGR